jgi:sulfatase modifying factor 1
VERKWLLMAGSLAPLGSCSDFEGYRAVGDGGGSGGDSGTAGVGAGGICALPTGGPAKVEIAAGFCIDATEVTRTQCQAWLAMTPGTSGQVSACAWNDTYVPGCYWRPGTKGDHPVVCVDWCDAFAYCQGVGERLCGKVEGGTNGFYDVDNASTSQWYPACSYGDTYEDAACHSRKNDPETTLEVGALASCQFYLGVFDLSGSVWEWENMHVPTAFTVLTSVVCEAEASTAMAACAVMS